MSKSSFWTTAVIAILVMGCGADPSREGASDITPPSGPAPQKVCAPLASGAYCCSGGAVPEGCTADPFSRTDQSCAIGESATGAVLRGEIFSCDGNPEPQPPVDPNPPVNPKPPVDPVPVPKDGSCHVISDLDRCCSIGLRPTWWCAEEDLRDLSSACTFGSGASRVDGNRYTCAGTPIRPAPTEPGSGVSTTLNVVEKALINANAVTRWDGGVDCVRNTRSTIHGSVQRGSTFTFETIEDVVGVLVPRGATARVIGEGLKANWRTYVRRQALRGVNGWHVVNIAEYKRDHSGKIWPNGIVFSGGTKMGHVSVHVSAKQPVNLELDQYSTRALKASASLRSRTLANQLRPGEMPTTQPALVNRVERYAIFQWCHDAWGCPAQKYLLDN